MASDHKCVLRRGCVIMFLFSVQVVETSRNLSLQYVNLSICTFGVEVGCKWGFSILGECLLGMGCLGIGGLSSCNLVCNL